MHLRHHCGFQGKRYKALPWMGTASRGHEDARGAGRMGVLKGKPSEENYAKETGRRANEMKSLVPKLAEQIVKVYFFVSH